MVFVYTGICLVDVFYDDVFTTTAAKTIKEEVKHPRMTMN